MKFCFMVNLLINLVDNSSQAKMAGISCTSLTIIVTCIHTIQQHIINPNVLVCILFLWYKCLPCVVQCAAHKHFVLWVWHITSLPLAFSYCIVFAMSSLLLTKPVSRHSRDKCYGRAWMYSTRLQLLYYWCLSLEIYGMSLRGMMKHYSTRPSSKVVACTWSLTVTISDFHTRKTCYD